MSTVALFVGRFPLLTFFALAYAFTWTVVPLLSVSPRLRRVFAAAVVTTVAGGKSGLKDVLDRIVRWRVGPQWYAVALDLPAAQALAVALVLGSNLRRESSVRAGRPRMQIKEV